MHNYQGQIGLSLNGKGWFATVIRWVTRSPANHVVIGLNNHECIGAEPGGAKIRRIDSFTDVTWSSFGLTDKQRRDIAKFARQREGVPYSWLTDVAIGVAMLLRTRVPRRLAEYLSSDYVYECAQLAQAAYLEAGIDLFDGKLLPGEVYPGSFVPVFRQHGWMK